jgi:hypothetical protein
LKLWCSRSKPIDQGKERITEHIFRKWSIFLALGR